MILLPIAIAQSITFAEGLFQFAFVVGLAFAAIALLVSFLRFQKMTGHLTLATEEDHETFHAANQFQAELLRRVGGGQAQSAPMVAANIGLSDQETLLSACGEQGVQEMRRWMLELLRKTLRSADIVLQIDEQRIGVILSSCKREQGAAIIARLLETVRTGLCRIGSGWSGHISAHAGCVSFPENGMTMLALAEALDVAFAASNTAENALFFTEPPRPPEKPASGLLRDEEEEEEEEVEEDEDQEKDAQVVRVNPMVDTLTGVMRRDRIGTAMAKYVAPFRRDGRPVTMLYLAVDHVERYLRQYGAGADEALLRATGELLQRETREDDLLGRYDDDSFLVLMPCSISEGLVVARRLCAAARRGQAVHGKFPLRMTISVGVAGHPEHGRTPGELFRMSEWALKEARERGGNAALLFERSLIREHRMHDETVDRF